MTRRYHCVTAPQRLQEIRALREGELTIKEIKEKFTSQEPT
ncbi:hypothetical protein [Laceyella putida]|uniref:Uncharacterized protein n=1 Tax=Laceyella putida TaxID=110101 RepID=A0ABW2RJH3_9BACL